MLGADLLNRYPRDSIVYRPDWTFATENKSEFYYIYIDSDAGVKNTAGKIIRDPCGTDHLCVFKKSERSATWTPVRQWIPYDTSDTSETKKTTH